MTKPITNLNTTNRNTQNKQTKIVSQLGLKPYGPHCRNSNLISTPAHRRLSDRSVRCRDTWRHPRHRGDTCCEGNSKAPLVVTLPPETENADRRTTPAHQVSVDLHLEHLYHHGSLESEREAKCLRGDISPTAISNTYSKELRQLHHLYRRGASASSDKNTNQRN